MQPLDRAFNAAIHTICNKLFPTGFDVVPFSPSSLAELKAAMKAAGSRMVVWEGGSEQTIYADKETNYMFRAWHDHCHLRGPFEFTHEGEVATYHEMIQDIRALYGHKPAWERLLWAEVVGQLEYQEMHGPGNFVIDQRAFTEAYLADPDAAVRETF